MGCSLRLGIVGSEEASPPCTPFAFRQGNSQDEPRSSDSFAAMTARSFRVPVGSSSSLQIIIAWVFTKSTQR